MQYRPKKGWEMGTSKKDLLRKIAALESMNDQLMTELAYLDRLMRQIGFSEGLKSIKDTALEIMDDTQVEKPPKKKSKIPDENDS